MRDPQNLAGHTDIHPHWTGAEIPPAEGCFVHRSAGQRIMPTPRQGATRRHTAPLLPFHAARRTPAAMTGLLKIVSLARDAGSRDGTVDGGKGAPAGARDTGSSGWCTKPFAQSRQHRIISCRGRTLVNAATLPVEPRRRTDPRFQAPLKQYARAQPARASRGAAHE